jgi:hypothetical protein
MTPKATQQSKVGKIPSPPRPSQNSHKYAEVRAREYLLPIEVESMRDALKKAGDRHAHRDSTNSRRANPPIKSEFIRSCGFLPAPLPSDGAANSRCLDFSQR